MSLPVSLPFGSQGNIMVQTIKLENKGNETSMPRGTLTTTIVCLNSVTDASILLLGAAEIPLRLIWFYMIIVVGSSRRSRRMSKTNRTIPYTDV